MASTQPLELLHEIKISELLPDYDSIDRWEASGVLARDGKYFVVFDNLSSVARLDQDLDARKMNGLCGVSQSTEGFEGVAYNPFTRHYYLLVESLPRGGSFQAEIVEYDETFGYVKSRSLDFSFEGQNKGFEAIAHVRRDEDDYVLALCEGNKCKRGAEGRKPGGGRVQVFEGKKKFWDHMETIKLPKTVQFIDYSAMAVDEERARVAVVSQESSMLWVGEFDGKKWTWRDDGVLYDFPRDRAGEVQYGNVEGVSWLAENEVVTVSDRRKNDQPDAFSHKDQALHLFRLPA